MRRIFLSLLAAGSVLITGPTTSKAATQIQVGQCLTSGACFSSLTPVPWNDNLTGADLAALGLGTSVDFIAAQTSQTVIRLGVTTITFTTSGTPVIETLPEFSGSPHSGPPFETDIVGLFSIPSGALSAVISGTFGNSVVPNSSAVNLCLGDGPCGTAISAVPLPAALPLFVTGLGALGLLGWRRKKKAPILSA